MKQALLPAGPYHCPCQLSKCLPAAVSSPHCQAGACVEGVWERKRCFRVECEHLMYSFLYAQCLCLQCYQASLFSAGIWHLPCLPRTFCLLFILITGFRWSFDGKCVAFLMRHVLLFMIPYDALRFPQRWSRVSAPCRWSAGLCPLKDSLYKTQRQARSAPSWILADKQTVLPWAREIYFYCFIWVCYCQGGSNGGSEKALLGQPSVNK